MPEKQGMVGLLCRRRPRERPPGMTKAAGAGGPMCSTHASRPPVGGPPHGVDDVHGTRLPIQAAFLKSAFARFSANTGQRLQRDEERQHFFLTLPAFISLRTVCAGVLPCFLPTQTLHRSRGKLRLG